MLNLKSWLQRFDKGSAKILLMRAMDEISKKMKAGVRVRIFTPVTEAVY